MEDRLRNMEPQTSLGIVRDRRWASDGQPVDGSLARSTGRPMDRPDQAPCGDQSFARLHARCDRRRRVVVRKQALEQRYWRAKWTEWTERAQRKRQRRVQLANGRPEPGCP
jgi:hypothetical protein